MTVTETAPAGLERWTHQWKELYEEVINTGLCTGCAACVISCPHEVIGYKHEEGPYADQLDRALRWLIRQQSEDGFLGGKANRYARMYCHGMATIALGEAYGMTHDESLKEPLTRAVQFIIDAQNTKDGGWRYVPGQISDMSIFGWQLMALKSAQTAKHFEVKLLEVKRIHCEAK